MELLDVLDEEGNMTGKVEDKDVIHEKALWHKEVDAWIVNEQGEILIQKRAATKKQAPNKWVSIQELEHIVENKDENYLFWREEYIEDVIHYLKKNI